MPELSRTPQSRLSGKLDFFVKTEDGVQDTSVLGGVLSVLSIVLVNYIPVYMDITFPRGRCSDLELQVQNFRGSGATNSRTMQKFPINQEGGNDGSGCRFTSGGGITFHPHSHALPNALEHEINKFHFGKVDDRVPGQTEPLIGHKALNMKHNTMTNYNLHVMPHSHESRSGRQVKAFSYSVSTQVEPCAGEHGIKCRKGMVQLSYDFSPLMIIDKETGQNILGFLTGLCAIAGGVGTISRLAVGFYSGYKAGKSD